MNRNSPRIAIGTLASFLLLAGSGNLQAASTSQRYEDECSECHGKAAEFVAEWLEFRDGKLIGMGSEKAVAEFLKKHQGLKQPDVDYYVDLLTRVAKEIGLK